jgi:hypothetical protein
VNQGDAESKAHKKLDSLVEIKKHLAESLAQTQVLIDEGRHGRRYCRFCHQWVPLVIQHEPDCPGIMRNPPASEFPRDMERETD